MAEKSQNRMNNFARPGVVDRGGSGLFRHFLALVICSDRQVQVSRCCQTEQVLQMHLARRRLNQVGAAYDVRDPLLRIVD